MLHAHGLKPGTASTRSISGRLQTEKSPVGVGDGHRRLSSCLPPRFLYRVDFRQRGCAPKQDRLLFRVPIATSHGQRVAI